MPNRTFFFRFFFFNRRLAPSIVTGISLVRVSYDVALIADTGISKEKHHALHAQYVHITNESDSFDHPHATMFVPVFRELNNAKESDIVAVLVAVLPCDRFLADLAPDDADGIHGKNEIPLHLSLF